MAQLEGKVTGWKNGFYHEKDQCEHLEQEFQVLKEELIHEIQLRIDGDTNLVTCMQIGQRLNEELEHQR